jgi:hypothetical protein
LAEIGQAPEAGFAGTAALGQSRRDTIADKEIPDVAAQGRDGSGEFVAEKRKVELAPPIGPEIAPADTTGRHFDEELVGRWWGEHAIDELDKPGSADGQCPIRTGPWLQSRTTLRSLPDL